MHINQVHCLYKDRPKIAQRIFKISKNSQIFTNFETETHELLICVITVCIVTL